MRIARLIIVTLMALMVFSACQQTKVVIRATEMPPYLFATPMKTHTETVATIPAPALTSEPTDSYPAGRIWSDFDEGVPLSREEYAIWDINEQFKPQFYGRKIEDWELMVPLQQ